MLAAVPPAALLLNTSDSAFSCLPACPRAWLPAHLPTQPRILRSEAHRDLQSSSCYEPLPATWPWRECVRARAVLCVRYPKLSSSGEVSAGQLYEHDAQGPEVGVKVVGRALHDLGLRRSRAGRNYSFLGLAAVAHTHTRTRTAM